MDYTLRELECFHAVAEELSFTRAARRLHLAQPPLSRHVRTLEEKLDARLFERTNRTVTLTPAGSLFYAQTRTILPQLRQAEEVTRRHARGEAITLRIGVVTAVIGPALIEAIQHFRHHAPTVRVEIRDDTPQALLRSVQSGELDGALIGVQPRTPPKGLQISRWRTEPLLAYLPFGHRLTGQPSCQLKELREEAFVAVERSAAPAFAEHLQELCLKAGFRPRIIQESSRAQAVAVMAASGGGVALLPASFRHWLGDAAPAIPLRNVSPLVHVFASRAGVREPALQSFLRSLQQA